MKILYYLFLYLLIGSLVVLSIRAMYPDKSELNGVNGFILLTWPFFIATFLIGLIRSILNRRR